MSFILDALKKSDAERQKRSTPGFADVPQARDRGGPPRWLWVVAGLLIVNLVAVAALFLRPGSDTAAGPPAADTAEVTPEDAAAAREARERSFSDIVAEAREAAAGAASPAAETRPRQPAGSGDGAPDTAQAPAQAAAAVRRTPQQPPTPEPTDTFESMRASGALQLPDLHLDIHVYSEQPSERFVFINMKKYRESETLAEGPTVRGITPEGVVLEQNGRVFLLPRQ